MMNTKNHRNTTVLQEATSCWHRVLDQYCVPVVWSPSKANAVWGGDKMPWDVKYLGSWCVLVWPYCVIPCQCNSWIKAVRHSILLPTFSMSNFDFSGNQWSVSWRIYWDSRLRLSTAECMQNLRQLRKYWKVSCQRCPGEDDCGVAIAMAKNGVMNIILYAFAFPILSSFVTMRLIHFAFLVAHADIDCDWCLRHLRSTCSQKTASLICDIDFAVGSVLFAGIFANGTVKTAWRCRMFNRVIRRHLGILAGTVRDWQFQHSAAEGYQHWADQPGVPQVRGMAWAVGLLWRVVGRLILLWMLLKWHLNSRKTWVKS